MTDPSSTRLASATEAEIGDQPRAWQRVLDLPEASLAPLPPPGKTVLGLGCGTSYHILESYARRRSLLGAGLTCAAVATEFDDTAEHDIVVLLSRSGMTTDLLGVARELSFTTPTLCITATPDSPLTEIAHEQVVLGFADETSVVQTRFATSALTLLRRSIGDRLDTLPGRARRALDEPLPVDPAVYDHLVFLGTGWSHGLAQEAALKCRESARMWTEAYPLLEYRHGPIACATDRTLVWAFAPPPPDLRAAISKTGATLRIADDDPQVELVRVHRLAVALARLRGIDADRPPHLSRAVVDE